MSDGSRLIHPVDGVVATLAERAKPELDDRFTRGQVIARAQQVLDRLRVAVMCSAPLRGAALEFG